MQLRLNKSAIGYSSCLALCCLLGCGSEFGATVDGVVTLDGNPISPGLITFAPENSSTAPSVSDLDPKGRFELRTNKKPGVKPGKYRVAIQAFRPPDVPEGQRTMKPSERLVPDKYFDINTSGLEFMVEPGSNTIPVELSSK